MGMSSLNNISVHRFFHTSLVRYTGLKNQIRLSGLTSGGTGSGLGLEQGVHFLPVLGRVCVTVS